MPDDPVALSRALLLAVKRDAATADLEAALAALDEGRLDLATTDDDAALAFWLNVYNAVTQLELGRNPDQYDKYRFFRRDLATVAGQDLSLDAIEHGILRRGYAKWGLGYVRWPLWSTFVRRMQPEARDPRIHFALNCGAASCPPIAAYSAADIDAELDRATASYLAQEVAYDPATDTVTVPRLMLWFRGDFGGVQGIRDLLRAFDCIPAGTTPTLDYAAYDWSLALENYRESA